jgi:hypothetical protein
MLAFHRRYSFSEFKNCEARPRRAERRPADKQYGVMGIHCQIVSAAILM